VTVYATTKIIYDVQKSRVSIGRQELRYIDKLVTKTSPTVVRLTKLTVWKKRLVISDQYLVCVRKITGFLSTG